MTASTILAWFQTHPLPLVAIVVAGILALLGRSLIWVIALAAGGAITAMMWNQ